MMDGSLEICSRFRSISATALTISGPGAEDCDSRFIPEGLEIKIKNVLKYETEIKITQDKDVINFEFILAEKTGNPNVLVLEKRLTAFRRQELRQAYRRGR